MRQLRELPRASHGTGTSSQTTSVTAASAPPNQPATTLNSDTQNKTASDPEQVAASSDETSKDAAQTPAAEQKDKSGGVSGEDVDMETCASTDPGQETVPKEAAAHEPPTKRALSPGVEGHFLFKCLLNVTLDESDALIEMHWVEGQNKDLMNQLCTYLKNMLLKSVAK